MNDIQGDEFKLLAWAKTGFKPFTSHERFLSPDVANPVPTAIVKSRCFKRESGIQKVYNGQLSINSICIACYRDDVVIECPHPLFQGSLCPECKEAVRDNMFITETKDPNTCKFCAICGIGRDVIICLNKDCNRMYCNACMTVLVGPKEYTIAKAQDPWYCYFCRTTDDDQIQGILVKRKDWKNSLFKFYQPLLQMPNVEFPVEKRPIRILSLSDGISRVKVALNHLGIVNDEYFASEVDQDAINVSKYHHKDSVKHLGGMQELNHERIAKLCPIDLLIGDFRCNDLSLGDPTRKGLYGRTRRSSVSPDFSGSGILIFEYHRILQKLIMLNGNRPLFWLFGNVQAMQPEYKNLISRFLGSNPALIDAKNFSPRQSARCYWGNIPGLYSPLAPTAAVPVIQTVATRSNSLGQGKVNGREDILCAIDLEKIFGFPTHYTDVGIGNKRRQELVENASSVQVLEYILNPLKEYFAIKTPKNDRICENCQIHNSIDE